MRVAPRRAIRPPAQRPPLARCVPERQLVVGGGGGVVAVVLRVGVATNSSSRCSNYEYQLPVVVVVTSATRNHSYE
eukprot:5717949-Pyramimonas_sp.AAC.1